MPIDNLAKNHFTDAEKQSIHNDLDHIMEKLQTLSQNLTAAERRRYGKVGEKNKLLINKVRDFQQSQPDRGSPEVDWEEFERDYQDRVQAEGMLMKVKSIEDALMSLKILRDYDNYTDSLRDYQYAQYKNRFADEYGYATKIDEIKAFFPNTGKTKKKTDGL